MYLSPIPLFNAWLGFSGDVPQIFWNIQSNEQRYKFLCKKLCELTEYASMLGIEINADRAEIERMAQEITDFKADFAEEFEDYFKEKVCEWINVNLTCILSNAVRFVTFGISDTGRFAINIPTNWEFLRFSMDNDGDSPNYGKLAINYQEGFNHG